MSWSARLPPWLSRVAANKHFKYGAPFLTLVVGAPFLLKNLQAARYEHRRVKEVSRELQESARDRGISMKDKEEVTPEKLHQEYMQKDYQDDYEIVRGPRPWEKDSLPVRRDNKTTRTVEKSSASYGV